MKLNVTQLLEKIVSMGASDLHVSVGSPPHVRIKTILQILPDYEPFSVDDVEYFLSQILDTQQREILEVNKEMDFSISLGQKARFRVNAFFQKGYPSISLRHIPLTVPNFTQLNLPSTLKQFCTFEQGLILVVGPAGQGKSTTLAAMVNEINETRAEHVLTIEDPIEYIFTNKKSLIEQREMFLDTHSWEVALRSVLRQDANVVLIGEMRDTDTISAALQIAETGHLVLATMHTNSAAQTVERIISSFSSEKQEEVRVQFSQVLQVVISQRLLPSAQKGVVPALEIMIGSDAVSNLIREGKTHMIDNIINTNVQLGMISLERSLAALVQNKIIDFKDAVRMANRPDILKRLIDNKSITK